MPTWSSTQPNDVPHAVGPMSIAGTQSLSDSPACDDHESTSPASAQDDLVRRLCLALSIAKRAIGFLGEDGYWDEEVPEGSFGPDKPLAETAMLLYVAAAVPG